MKKIIFMGTPPFAATILKGLIQQVEYEVIAVVTQPDRPVGRKKILTASPVKKTALEANIPIYQPDHLAGSKDYEMLLQMQADLIITAAYGQKIPQNLLLAPSHGAINVHASLLPKYRGGAPIHYAIWRGEKETGITIMKMVEEMDAGDILTQSTIPISDKDDVGLLFEKLAVVGKELLLNFLPKYFDGEYQASPQEESQVSYSPTIKKQEEQLDWQQSAQALDRHIRAFRPFPTTYTLLDGQRVKIWQAQPLVKLDADIERPLAMEKPGQIIATDNHHFYVRCGEDSYLAVSEYQPAGKKRLMVEDYLKGTPAEHLIGKHFGTEKE
ncbi:methionyl-tRNA formyltransferase [Facklamia miroungae]|uniref:Methionyl-tRNA formyltransferase n=1 Tax=Facklamia miroungae TaxID=120956 RepID=A0A1G7PR90_9LACT|nr:methionyl-tRNA formyltransferase [Facklamia miroungae]NKZ28801.1 methionyl-tRNA formyltransferase [Facklamia miroungae]SDF88817.1 methionyl-tRNA formyltransferase [Facklamia miroungae]